MFRRIVGYLALSILLVFAGEALAQGKGKGKGKRGPQQSLTKIAGDVYQFKNRFHQSVVMITPEGAIISDPINKGAATWLKAEIKKRFNQDVKYVVYSHDHADHISGGEVYAETATFVAHRRAKDAIIGEQRPTQVPDITFTDRLTLELAGKTVELVHVGRNHSDNSIIMHFPAERVVHAVDFIPVQAVAFRTLPDSYIGEWIESLKRVEAIDFEILSPGHGRIGKKADVRAFRGYMEDLHEAVLAAARIGMTKDEAVAAVKLEKYKSWSGYGRMFRLNVAGMYDRVQANRRGNGRPAATKGKGKRKGKRGKRGKRGKKR